MGQCLWKETAYSKYSRDLAEDTIHLYRNGINNNNDTGNHDDWKAMVRDDNKRGAIPTLNDPKPCRWLYNRNDCYYCCLITCIKWFRQKKEVRLYLDVYGEHDLRPPIHSTIMVQPTRINDGITGASSVLNCSYRGIWKSELPLNEQRAGHYKGYIEYSDSCFEYGGIYKFCYANLSHDLSADYKSIELFSIQPGEGFDSLFRNNSNKNENQDNQMVLYTSNISPFKHDNQEIKINRWKGVVHEQIIKRHI